MCQSFLNKGHRVGALTADTHCLAALDATSVESRRGSLLGLSARVQLLPSCLFTSVHGLCIQISRPLSSGLSHSGMGPIAITIYEEPRPRIVKLGFQPVCWSQEYTVQPKTGLPGLPVCADVRSATCWIMSNLILDIFAFTLGDFKRREGLSGLHF